MADATLELDNCNNSFEYTGKDDVIQKYIAPVVKVVLEEIVDSVVSQLSNQMSIRMSSERFHPSVDTLELDNCNISFEYTGQKSAMIPKYIISLRFHSSVRKVESGTFENCYLLREVEFNNGLCSIRKHAFFHRISDKNGKNVELKWEHVGVWLQLWWRYLFVCVVEYVVLLWSCSLVLC